MDRVNHVLFLAKEQSMFPSFFTAVNWNVFLLNFRWAFLYFCWLPFDVFQQNWSESRLCIIFKFFQKKMIQIVELWLKEFEEEKKQLLTSMVQHSLNNIHKCITHACALKWESLELEKK